MLNMILLPLVVMEALPRFTCTPPMDVAVVLEPLSSGIWLSFRMSGKDVVGVPSLLAVWGGNWLSTKLEGWTDVPSDRRPRFWTSTIPEDGICDEVEGLTRNVWVRFRTLLISEEDPGASPLAPFAFDLLRPYFEMIMNYISYNG